MNSWFNQLPRREQLLLVLMGAAIVAWALYLFAFKPLAEANAALAQRNELARQSLHTVRMLAAELKSLSSSGTKQSGGDRNLPSIVDSTVASNQLKMKRFQPSASGDVQVRFENMPFNNIIAWLNQIETDYGVVIKELSVSPANGAGMVNVSVRMKQGA